MPRRIHNWSYDDVTDFLTENGFTFLRHLRGSHQRWIKRNENGEPDKTVEVNLTRRSYSPKTLKRMILTSGIDIDKWIEWTRS
jgi:hypothetical protein